VNYKLPKENKTIYSTAELASVFNEFDATINIAEIYQLKEYFNC